MDGRTDTFKYYIVKTLSTDRTICVLFVGLKDDLITRLLEHYQQVGESEREREIIHYGVLYMEFMHTFTC